VGGQCGVSKAGSARSITHADPHAQRRQLPCPPGHTACQMRPSGAAQVPCSITFTQWREPATRSGGSEQGWRLRRLASGWPWWRVGMPATPTLKQVWLATATPAALPLLHGRCSGWSLYLRLLSRLQGKAACADAHLASSPSSGCLPTAVCRRRRRCHHTASHTMCACLCRHPQDEHVAHRCCAPEPERAAQRRHARAARRSEERRVGKECGWRGCRESVNKRKKE